MSLRDVLLGHPHEWVATEPEHIAWGTGGSVWVCRHNPCGLLAVDTAYLTWGEPGPPPRRRGCRRRRGGGAR